MAPILPICTMIFAVEPEKSFFEPELKSSAILVLQYPMRTANRPSKYGKKTDAEWKQLAEAAKNRPPGLTLKAFCEMHGLSTRTLRLKQKEV